MTTTDPRPATEAAEPHDPGFDLLAALTRLLLRWSYEGTARSEAIVKRVAARYGRDAEVAFLPDSAMLTVGSRTIACTAMPVVPPLHQVSALKRLLLEIERDGLDPGEARRRLEAVQRMPVRFSRPWQVVGLMLFSVGFGISIQATWQEVVASAVLGFCIGLLVIATDGRPRLQLLAPFAASVLVSTLVLIAFEHDCSTAARSSS